MWNEEWNKEENAHRLSMLRHSVVNTILLHAPSKNNQTHIRTHNNNNRPFHTFKYLIFIFFLADGRLQSV